MSRSVCACGKFSNEIQSTCGRIRSPNKIAGPAYQPWRCYKNMHMLACACCQPARSLHVLHQCFLVGLLVMPAKCPRPHAARRRPGPDSAERERDQGSEAQDEGRQSEHPLPPAELQRPDVRSACNTVAHLRGGLAHEFRGRVTRVCGSRGARRGRRGAWRRRGWARRRSRKEWRRGSRTRRRRRWTWRRAGRVTRVCRCRGARRGRCRAWRRRRWTWGRCCDIVRCAKAPGVVVLFRIAAEVLDHAPRTLVIITRGGRATLNVEATVPRRDP